MPNTSLQTPPDSASAPVPPVSTVTLPFKALDAAVIHLGKQPHRRVKIRISDTTMPGGKKLLVTVLDTTNVPVAWGRYEHGSESEILTLSKEPGPDLVLKIEATEAPAANSATSNKRKSSLTIPPTTEVDGEEPV